VSIYENGSEDQTKTYLELLRTILQRRKVSNTIQFSYDQKDPHAHRIDMLARVRNLALDPVFTQTDETKFEKVIFMNDVFFCADDIKELLHQSYIQKSDLTCGLDFDTDKDGVGFYDTW
jgi:alpha-1,3-mannosyltransferase